jgi:hypothetical protein
MRLLSGKFSSWEKSRAKAHPHGRHFYKVLYENDLKIKNKPDPGYFKLCIYTMKLSAGLPNLVRQSLLIKTLTLFFFIYSRNKYIYIGLSIYKKGEVLLWHTITIPKQDTNLLLLTTM